MNLQIIKTGDLKWNALINNKVVGEAKYYIDQNQRFWLSNIGVNDDYRQIGIARSLVLAAVAEYGQVYFSDTERLDFNIRYPNHGYDSRYLTEDGRIFVEKLISNGDIPNDWLREQIP